MPDKIRSERKPFVPAGYDDIAVLKQTGGSAFGLYIYLSLRTGTNNGCWPSYKTIKADTGLANSTIKKALDTLVKHGLISVEHQYDDAGKTASNHYVIHDPEAMVTDDPGTPDSGISRSPVSGEELDSVPEEDSEDSVPSEPAQAPSPYDIFESFLEKTGNERPADETYIAQQCKAAKNMLGRGYSSEDVEACIDSMLGDPWRSEPFDLLDVQRVLPKRKMNDFKSLNGKDTLNGQSHEAPVGLHRSTAPQDEVDRSPLYRLREEIDRESEQQRSLGVS